jgi:hypothetical protein
MRSLGLPLLVLALGCRVREPAAGDLAAPLVLHEATLVAFTLGASDTLESGEQRAALEEFRAYTALIVPRLADYDVAFRATTADSVVIVRADGVRRVVMLSGLDYPYGYVLVEPGFAESILTGVLTDEELEEEVDWFFGTEAGEGGTETSRHLAAPAGSADWFRARPWAAARRGP